MQLTKILILKLLHCYNFEIIRILYNEYGVFSKLPLSWINLTCTILKLSHSDISST